MAPPTPHPTAKDDTRNSPPLSSCFSSPLSSLGSRSPSPPADYPSPLSSNISEASMPISRKRDMPDAESGNQPPAKKQKASTPKELKTEYLDLSTLDDSSDEAEHKINGQKLRKLTEVLRSKRKIVIIAGAGISVSAGIPDFRSSTGLFKSLRTQHKSAKSSGKHLFDASVYRNDNSTKDFHDMVRELSHLTQTAAATDFHHMVATLAEEGRLLRLYTQNVDGIDTSLEPLATTVPLNKKGPWPKTIQLHGGLNKMVCSKCGHLEGFKKDLFKGSEAPSCSECEETDAVRVAGGLRSHGIGCLRPRMVLYNEFNPDEDAIGAVSHADLKTRPDTVIVVGTSLKVPGIRRLVKEMCAVARGRRGGFTAWVNLDSEPLGVEFKDSWDLVVRGESDAVARHVGLPRWYDKDLGKYEIVSNETTPPGSQPEVVLPKKHLDAVKSQGLFTPGSSSREQSPLVANTKQKQALLPGAKPVVNHSATKKKTAPSKPNCSQITLTLPARQNNKLAFTTTKTNAVKDTKPKDTKSDLGRPPKSKSHIKVSGGKKSVGTNIPVFLNLQAPKLSAVSPTDHRQNFESPTKKLDIQVPPPQTHQNQNQPPDASHPSNQYDHEATISPKSKPSGMSDLIS
ncbi:DHS-like NAD/FAD-binding domain-containing protein [Calycina marina]|uniref:DHS-like NAD/FAD-binding domain-containing protein n=1 Tax=Calycina marina TaxID=1763456 RepID=A0A9P7Z519_9HELO|nr:DHS-like NAD/FAD-binding domain-containing protein [Calycina marina]